MDLKKIIIVSLMLFVLAAGAVSASQDIQSDINQTAMEEDDPVLEDVNDDGLKSADEDVINVKENGEEIVGYNESKIWCSYDSTQILDTDDEVLSFRSSDPTATGNFSVYVDGSIRYTTLINQSSYKNQYCSHPVNLSDLKLSASGTYQVKATFNDNVLVGFDLDVRYYPFFLDEIIWGYGRPIEFYIWVPNDATGKLTLTLNGKSYNVKYKDGTGYLDVDTVGWDVGYYNVTLTYGGDIKYVPDSFNKTILLDPYVNFEYLSAIGEKINYVELIANLGFSDNADVTPYILVNDTFVELSNFTVKFQNGMARLYMNNFDEGYYYFHVTYHAGNASIKMKFDVLLVENSKGFSASVSPSIIKAGSTVTVKVKGPKLKNEIRVYVDGDFKKSALLSKGSLSFTLSGLKVGTHLIHVYLEMTDSTTEEYDSLNGYYFAYNTFVTVKKFTKLTISKVKVRKYAKKLTIKATLMIDGKPAKGKVIKFKFNKKTYKAKTNKKGIAKITVKRAVLKKLKVGKKVKYQATYGKKTVTKTVKVKR